MEFVPTQISIGHMVLANTDHSSTVSFGSAFAVNKNVNAKKTQGTGQQLADACLRYFTVSTVLDDDMADTCSRKVNKSDPGGV